MHRGFCVWKQWFGSPGSGVNSRWVVFANLTCKRIIQGAENILELKPVITHCAASPSVDTDWLQALLWYICPPCSNRVSPVDHYEKTPTDHFAKLFSFSANDPSTHDYSIHCYLRYEFLESDDKERALAAVRCWKGYKFHGLILAQAEAVMPADIDVKATNFHRLRPIRFSCLCIVTEQPLFGTMCEVLNKFCHSYSQSLFSHTAVQDLYQRCISPEQIHGVWFVRPTDTTVVFLPSNAREHSLECTSTTQLHCVLCDTEMSIPETLPSQAAIALEDCGHFIPSHDVDFSVLFQSFGPRNILRLVTALLSSKTVRIAKCCVCWFGILVSWIVASFIATTAIFNDMVHVRVRLTGCNHLQRACPTCPN